MNQLCGGGEFYTAQTLFQSGLACLDQASSLQTLEPLFVHEYGVLFYLSSYLNNHIDALFLLLLFFLASNFPIKTHLFQLD